MKKLLLILGFLCSVSVYSQADLIGNMQNKKDSAQYKFIKLYTESYANVNLNYVPKKLKTFLFLSNAPEEAIPKFKRDLEKADLIAFNYYDLFKYDVTYSQKEIDSILKVNKIDAFLKIGFNRDIYNTGIKFQSAFTEMGSFGSMKSSNGTVVKLYVDFYNNEFQKDPFIRTEGVARSSVSTGRDITLCDKLFWIVIDNLLEKGYILK